MTTAPRPGRTKRWAAVLSAATLVATLAATSTGAGAADAYEEVGTLGGPGLATVYPSGLALDGTGRVVAADTGNDRVAAFDAAGTELWTYGGDGELGNPRDIAITDDGSVYVADTLNGRVVALTADGQLVAAGRGDPADPIGSPIGISSAGVNVIVSDGKTRSIRVLAPDLTEIGRVEGQGACAFDKLRDAAVDSAGDYYVANYLRQNVVKVDAAGTCLWTDGTGVAGGAADQYRAPYGVDVDTAADLGEIVLVADSNNQRVKVLGTDGSAIATVPVGSEHLRRVHGARDGSGDFWIADLWGTTLQRFARDPSAPNGWVAAESIGGDDTPLRDDASFNQPHEVAQGPDGSYWVADMVNHRIVHLSRGGAVLGACGARGWQTPGMFNWPQSVDVDPATGDLWIADTKQHRLQRVDADCAGGAFIGGPNAGTSAGAFNRPTSLRIRDGHAFVADSVNNRVQVLALATGAPVAELTAVTGAGPLQDPRSVWIDGDTLHVADRANGRVVAAEWTGSGFGSATVEAEGLDLPSGVAVLPDGRVAVAEQGADRVSLIDTTTGEREVLGAGVLNKPAAVFVDSDGRLLVSDTQNHVVRIYDTDDDGGSGGPDVTAPGGSIASPSQGAELPEGPVTISGTLTDDVGVVSARLAIRDRQSGQWWNGTTFGAAFSWADPVVLDSSGATSTGFTSIFDGGVPGGDYFTFVQAFDAAGNRSPNIGAGFDIAAAGGGGEDTAAPIAALESPAQGEEVPEGPIITISGTVTDDVGVVSARLAVRDRQSGLWWNGSQFGASFAWLDPSLSAPGATSTTFAYEFTGGAVGGDYFTFVQAFDAAGNRSANDGNGFDVVAADATDAAPEATITAPTEGETLPSGSVTIAGTATDDAGVSRVEVTIVDRGTGRWWSPGAGAWSDTPVVIEPPLAAPGTTSTEWSLTFDEPSSSGSGSYEVTARAFDVGGRAQDVPASVTFTVEAGDGGGDVAPSVSIDAPANRSTQPQPLDFVGQASDDEGVVAVDLGIRDRQRGLWWNAEAGRWGGFDRFAVTLDAPGAPQTGWSYTFDPSDLGSGDLWYSVRAYDADGNESATVAQRVSLVAGIDDAIPSFVGTFARPGLADLTPVDVASTASHHYVVDVARYRIARVDRSTGTVDAEVGGVRTISSDPGERIAAARAIAVDSAGRVYVADTPNQRVAVYDADLNYLYSYGDDLAGPGTGDFQQIYGVAVGLGLNAAGQTVETLYTVDGGGAGSDGLPHMLAWDLSNPTAASRRPFAEPIATGFNQPRMVHVHPVTNDVWVVNARDRQIVVIDVDGNEVARFGGRGSDAGEFSGDPRGITIDPTGSLAFVADEGNRRISVFSAETATIGDHRYDIFEADESQPEHLVDVRGIDVAPDGILAASDEWDFALKEFEPGAAGATFVGELFGDPPPVGGVNSPRGLDVDAEGRVYVSDWWNQRIHRWDSDGSNPVAWGERGTRDDPGSINFAWDVAVQPGTGRVFVANRESHEIQVFEVDDAGNATNPTRWGTRVDDPVDDPLGQTPPVTEPQFEFPHGVAFDAEGRLLVTDSSNGRVLRFSIDAAGDGTLVDVYGSEGRGDQQLLIPTGIDVAADGTIWVADTGNDRIQAIDPDTGELTAFEAATDGTSVAAFARPWGVTVAPDGRLWVADTNNDRIVIMTSDGELVAAASAAAMGVPSTLSNPFDVVFLASGNALVSDTFNNRIIELEP